MNTKTKQNLKFNILKIKKNRSLIQHIILEIFNGVKTHKYLILKQNSKLFLKILNTCFKDLKSYIYIEAYSLEVIYDLLENLFKFYFIEVLVKNNLIYFIRLYYKNKIFYFYRINLLLPFFIKKQNFYFFKYEEQNLLINFFLKVSTKKINFTKSGSSTSIFFKTFLSKLFYFNSLKLKKYQSNFIFKSYKGGQIFLKKNFNFANYFYDINFQYGWNMRKNFPIYSKNFISVSINILQIVGFFKVKVTQIPFLNYSFILKYNIGDIYILYSSELKFLIEIGFQFKIIYGVIFKKKKIFKEYFNIFLKNLKINSRFDKNLKKNALVSLYGRLAMITENFQNVSYPYIHISAAISSESRIQILKYLISYNYLWFYSDTDSLFLKKPIPIKYVLIQIGFMKPIINKFFLISFSLFIRPRFYLINLKQKNYLNKFFILKTSGIEKKELKPLSFFQIAFNKTLLVHIKKNNNINCILSLKLNYLNKLKIFNYKSFKIIRYKNN